MDSIKKHKTFCTMFRMDLGKRLNGQFFMPSNVALKISYKLLRLPIIEKGVAESSSTTVRQHSLSTDRNKRLYYWI